MNNPKLRFKADDGSEFPEWEERRIDSFANCYAGATPSTKVAEYWQNGSIPWMSSGEVNNREIYETEKKISELGYEKSSTKMVKPNTVVIALAGQGKTRGMVAIARISVCTNQSLCAIETNDMVNDDYLYQYLITQYDNLRRISSGDGTRGGLNLQLVGEYKVFLPVFHEQCKIADCLSSVDDIIIATQSELLAWEKRKKGVMQKLFSQEVRFKADDGSEFPEWTLTVFSDLYQDCREKNADCRIGLDRMISVATMCFVPRDGDAVSQEYLAGCTLLPSNAIAFEGHRSKDYSYGRFVLNDIGDGIMSNRFKCLYPSVGWETTQDVRFWKEYIHNEQVMRKILVRCTKAGTMMNELVILEFLQQSVLVPCLEEQKKIGACLASMDEVIHSLEQELFAWKEFKKGLLQQMFV